MSTMTVTPHIPVQRSVEGLGHSDRQVVVAPSAPRVPAAAAPVGRVRLTRRGRALVTLVFLGALLAGMISLGGWATASLSGGTPEPVQVVEVQSGDTLYDLAARVAAPGDVREMVYRIQELNSLPGAQIAEGQRLAVPRG